MSTSDEARPVRARRSFADDVVTMLISRVAVQIAGFITGIIVARTLGVEARGLIAAILFAPQLVLTVCAGGMGHSAAFHMGQKTWPAASVVETLLTVGLISSFIGMAASLGWILIAWEDDYTAVLVASAVLIVPGTVFFNYIAGVFLGYQRIPTYAIMSWGPGIGKFVLTVLFVLVFGFGTAGAVGAIALAGLLVAGTLLYKLSQLHSIRAGWNSELARGLVKSGMTFSFVYFLMILIYRANVFLIQRYGTIDQLGTYSVGSMLAELIWQIPTVVSALVFAKSAAAQDGKVFSEKVATLARLTLLLGILASLVIAAIIPYFVVLAYGRDFAPSADIVRALLPGTVAIMVFKILRQDLTGRGRPWVALWVVVPMLIVIVVAGRFVIPTYGALGAAYTTSAVYIAGTIGLIGIYARAVDLSIGEVVLFRRSDFVRLRDVVAEKLGRRFRR